MKILKISSFLLLTSLFSCEKPDPDDRIIWEEYNIPEIGITYSFAFSGDGVMYSSTSNGIYRSYDKGKEWVMILESGQPTSICVDGENNLYVNVKGLSIMKSGDEGESWTKVYIGFTGKQQTLMAIRDDGAIYLAAPNDNTLYYSTDNMNSWQNKLFNQGILDLVELNGKLYLTSYTIFGYRMDILDSALKEVRVIYNQSGFPRGLAMKGEDLLYYTLGDEMFEVDFLNDSINQVNSPGPEEGYFAGFDHLIIGQSGDMYITRDASYPVESYPSIVYRSKDSGISWEVIDPVGEYIYAVSLSPQDRLYIGVFTHDSSAKIFRSSRLY